MLVTVAGVRGSAPREVGAAMLVTARDTRGTIGGGELEYQCTQIAARLLRDEADSCLRRFPLGSNCGQCCGGVVDVLFEPLADIGVLDALRAERQARRPAVLATTLDADGRPRKSLLTGDRTLAGTGVDDAILVHAKDAQKRQGAWRVDTPGRDARFLLLEPVQEPAFHIAVFGAGHVGSALVQLLSGLDCRLRWIDSRRDIFPPRLPGNVQAIATDDPEREVAALPAGSWFLVMTHSHALDQAVVGAVLRRGDAAYCGLIGSRTKRRRFETRLKQAGLRNEQLARLTCPIGISGVTGKAPREIAIATAAEILKLREQQLAKTEPDRPGLELIGS